MRKTVIILLIFICNLIALDDLSIYSAFQKAQETNRPIYYIVTSASCEHCYKHLKNTIIPNNEIIRKDFILAMADLSKGDKFLVTYLLMDIHQLRTLLRQMVI